MSNLEDRMTAMETKFKILEETLETLKKMSLSEQMESYIQKRSQALKMVDLLNSVSDQPALDFSKEETQVKAIQAKKNDLDRQITKAISGTEDFSEQSPDDLQFFEYEIETGIESNPDLYDDVDIDELVDYIGKGIRITGYTGFNNENIIIPSEINDMPVVSIGEKAFMNVSFSKIVFPKTLKAILYKAFSGCKQLTEVLLPYGVEYLGYYCFEESGIIRIDCPETLKGISPGCFSNCDNFIEYSGGNYIKKIGHSAFGYCKKLKNITIPETVEGIDDGCFEETDINTIIVPQNVKEISCGAFSYNIKVIVFLGKGTEITPSFVGDDINDSTTIYCLPGSKAQKYAQEHNKHMKPLSEFKMEDYDV